MRALILTVTLAMMASTVGFGQSQITPEEAQKRVEERARQIEEKKAERERLKQYEKQDSEVEREARKQLQREADRDKRDAREQARALSNAAITGCDPFSLVNPQGVYIEPRATGDHSWTTHVKVRVTNLESVYVDIDDESGQIVRGLCPGASITLFRSRQMFRDGNYVTFRYIARGEFPDKSLGIVESPSYRLSSHDVSSGRTQKFDNWQIRLRKVRVQK